MTKTKGAKAFTNKEFITKAETVHGNKYDYSKRMDMDCYNYIIALDLV